MDGTPGHTLLRWLLVPLGILLAVPALVFIGIMLACRAVFVGALELLACILPWRRVERSAGRTLRPPHFLTLSADTPHRKDAMPFDAGERASGGNV